MHRDDRLTAIVRTMRQAGRTSAEQLAERFGVSPRTIYRDIAELHRQGVPVVGEAGVGYHLDLGAELDAVAFTADELAALLDVARKGLAVAGARRADSILRAMTKARQALPSALLEALGD